MAAYYETCPTNYGVGLFRAAVRARELVDAAREGVARFIGASARGGWGRCQIQQISLLSLISLILSSCAPSPRPARRDGG